ncbi:MAG TPA: FMN-binding protein [Candidatus Saccharimonadales bacterium]|nr:FMN-binding protein [Candidatus Saccharimonadales bacterium]
MRKYSQITFILAVFFALVWWRDRHPEAANPIVGLPANSAVSNQPVPTSSSPTSIVTSPPAVTTPTGRYKNGRYTGISADAFYGNVQVEVVITGGKITDVIFLDHPSDNGTSDRINSQAMPLLKEEAIQAQSANVDGVTGASATSGAFIQSLGSALSQAI